jgi:hypothetical protein
MRMVWRRDETPGLCSHGFHEPRIADSPAVQHRRSRFETLARLPMPPETVDLVRILLGSAFPVGATGCQALRPLWAEEAMHRAMGFMRLAGAAGRDRTARLDHDLARDLAVQFRKLEAGDERRVLPCAAVLRNVIAGIGTLFGGPANVIVETKIVDLSLPAYKRRALVLAAAELVNSALLHAFAGRAAGLIEVGLTATGRQTACLRVADNGAGFTTFPPSPGCGVAADLGDLLEAELVYDRLAGWTVAEIAFPVAAD